MSIGHAPNRLIADYAAGALPPGMSLLVASHLTYCPACRDKVARLEALGGALLAEANVVAPAPHCIEKALARIAAAEAVEPERPEADAALPRLVCQKLAGRFCDLRWQSLRPGLTSCRLDGFAAERVGLVRGEPGVCMRAEAAPEGEATLVLAGRLREGPQVYDRGELAFAAEGSLAGPDVIGQEACLCLVVQPSPNA